MKKDNTVVTDSQQNKQKGGYGLLSLMAMIIGIVIGSGIFAKNAGLISSAGSTAMVAFAWVLGALIIITMVIAFLEIISVTEITGEQSTITNWGRRLVGIKFGKIAGVYFTLMYFPVLMAGLFQIGADSLLHTISYAVTAEHTDAWYNSLTSNAKAYEGTLIVVAFVLLLIVMGINAISILPGKYFQNLGTTVKTLPLILIIIVFITMLGTNEIHFASNQDLIIHGANSRANINNGLSVVELDGSFSVTFKALMATMPAILFAFDGFLLAGNLSREAKKPSTFRTAFIASIIFIIVIYLLYSMAILGLGDYTSDAHGKYGTISNAIYASFDANVARVIDPAVTGIITISILTGVSGCSIASYRSMADLSTQNIFKDENGEILEKNKRGINSNGAFIIIGLSMIWFFVGSSFDSLLAATGHGVLNIVGFSTDMIIVWAYFVYAIIIIFAMINRFTKKTLVHKRLLFWPAAIISTVCTVIITLQFAKMVLLPGAAGVSDPVWQAKMIYTVIFFAVFILTYIWLGFGTGATTARVEATESTIAKAEKGNAKAIAILEQFARKDVYTAAYYGITVDELHAERQAVHIAVEEEKLRRKEQHNSKKNSISDKEAKRLAKQEEAEIKKASSKPKKEKAVKSDSKKEEVDYSVKKVAPKSKK